MIRYVSEGELLFLAVDGNNLVFEVEVKEAKFFRYAVRQITSVPEIFVPKPFLGDVHLC